MNQNTFHSHLVKSAQLRGVTRFAVGAFVVRSGKVLLLRRAKGEFLEGFYELPSGVVESCESFRQALRRETTEETGLMISTIGPCIGFFDYESSGQTYRQFNFLVTLQSEKDVVLSSEHNHYMWVDADCIEQNGLDAVMVRQIERYLEKRTGGLVVAFEGIDGVGKSTFSKMVTDWFSARGRKTCHVEEFPASFLSGAIGRLVKKRRFLELSIQRPSPVSQTLLLQSCHAFKFETVIAPALRRGELVISDRSLLSVIAYQRPILINGGLTESEADRMLWSLDAVIPAPDIVVYLDPMLRSHFEKTADRLDAFSEGFLKRVAKSYKDTLTTAPCQVVRVSSVLGSSKTAVERIGLSIERAIRTMSTFS